MVTKLPSVKMLYTRVPIKNNPLGKIHYFVTTVTDFTEEDSSFGFT